MSQLIFFCLLKAENFTIHMKILLKHYFLNNIRNNTC